MRYAAPVLVLAALAACEGRSPVEPAPAPTPVLMAQIIGRVQDSDTGQLVPARVEFARDAWPGTWSVTSKTGEFFISLPPSLWHLRATATGYQETRADLIVKDSPTTVTVGMRR